jgi:hypothetical protein
MQFNCLPSKGNKYQRSHSHHWGVNKSCIFLNALLLAIPLAQKKLGGMAGKDGEFVMSLLGFLGDSLLISSDTTLGRQLRFHERSGVLHFSAKFNLERKVRLCGFQALFLVF